MKITIEHKGWDTAFEASVHPIKRFGEVKIEYTEDEHGGNKRTAVTDMPTLLELIREQILNGLNAEMED